MEENKKQIANHHDNVTKLEVETAKIADDFKYIRDKVERDIIYLKTSGNRVVDIKISNYDKIIDLEIFFLKLFVPVFSISFTVGANIVGIDTYILKWLSFSIIVLVVVFLLSTFISRKKIVNSEQKNHDKEYELVRKELVDYVKNLEVRAKKIVKELEGIESAQENESNLL